MGTRLYVGNLSFSSTNETVREAFARIGEVTDVHLVTDRTSGQSRGFGFVTMGSPAEAQKAIETMNGAPLDGRALRVNEAEERPQRGGFGGGGVPATRSATELISSLTDALGNKTSYQYSSDGLLTTFIDALNGTWVYQYDGAARASSRTDPGGSTLAANYGVDNGITGLGAGDARISFDYSGLQRNTSNRLVSYTDS